MSDVRNRCDRYGGSDIVTMRRFASGNANHNGRSTLVPFYRRTARVKPQRRPASSSSSSSYLQGRRLPDSRCAVAGGHRLQVPEAGRVDREHARHDRGVALDGIQAIVIVHCRRHANDVLLLLLLLPARTDADRQPVNTISSARALRTRWGGPGMICAPQTESRAEFTRQNDHQTQ